MGRKIISLNRDWKFHRGDVASEEAGHNFGCRSTNAGIVNGPAGKNYSDSLWQDVHLPHDFVNEGPFGPQFDMMHGYRDRPNAWYRKSFVLNESYADRQLMLCFEGINVHCEIYFNGSLMERSFNGFQEIWVDITPRAYTDGRTNVLAVYVRSDANQLWSYEGGGIYRNVWLYAKAHGHIARDGVWLNPKRRAGTQNTWDVDMQITVENSALQPLQAEAQVRLSYKGQTQYCACINGITAEAMDSTLVHHRFSIDAPLLWDVDSPNLYNVEISILAQGQLLDQEQLRTGFRYFSIHPKHGFFLNGRHLKINGACCHQEHGGVGIAVPDRLAYYRMQRLKDLGANGLRCAHHMMSRAIYDACDELGLIVMDENRLFETRPENLEALRRQVLRNRNHPSIVFWSLFNEEPLQNTEEGARIYRILRSTVEKLDDSRLFTGGMNGHSFDGAGLQMDVAGKNYGLSQIEGLHEKYPNLPLLGSEAMAAWATRGSLETSFETCQCADYDTECFNWSATAQKQWAATHDKDWYAGVFIWAGFDYRGEPSPFKWPAISTPHGVMDVCGFAKNEFYFTKATFTDEPMVKLVPHWNHNDKDMVKVVAVSNCQQIELFLNGDSLGKKPGNIADQPCWMVPFTPGTLCAKAYVDGKEVAQDCVTTAGNAGCVQIHSVYPDVSNNGMDILILNIAITDCEGNIVPTADNLLHFEVTGDGRLLGVGNGSPTCHEIDHMPDHRVFGGLCQAIIAVEPGAQALEVVVSGAGLKTARYSPEISPCRNIKFMKSTANYYIGGFTMSEVSPQPIDPTMYIGENDVNTFMPLDIPVRSYQQDFYGGWRLYRTVLRLPQMRSTDGQYTVEIGSVSCNAMKIYVADQLVHSHCNDEKPVEINNVRFSFPGGAGEEKELRILMQYAPSTRFGGISQYVKYVEA